MLKKNIISGICCACSILFLSSCASVATLQPTVNNLAVSGRYDQALSILSDPHKYGKNNELLFLLDKGLVLHLAGRYEESIEAFEEAKQKYDELYTESVSKIAASWLWNDNALPYTGEDFERVMVNIFQAVNYASLGQIDEALVEARDVDSTLNTMNGRYDAKQKNTYTEDAFARLLMGIFYETDGNMNDALVSYRLSLDAYQGNSRDSSRMPKVLKENLLAAAESYGDRNFDEYRREFAGVDYVPLDERKKQAEVYLIEYEGLSPVKIPVRVPVPLPDGKISQIAFPKYLKRHSRSRPAKLTAASISDSTTRWDETELVEDIEAVAIRSLEDRRARYLLKAAARPAAKYFAEKALEQKVEDDRGKKTADVVRVLGSLYNVISEQADLRSWQTLPARVRLARLILSPGTYEISADEESFGEIELAAGEKRFFILRN